MVIPCCGLVILVTGVSVRVVTCTNCLHLLKQSRMGTPPDVTDGGS